MKRIAVALILILTFLVTGCSLQRQTEESLNEMPVYVTKYVINTDGLDLRTQPTNTASIVCTAPKGQPVSFVKDVGNGYSEVVYNGNTGYVLSAYLTSEKPVEEKPATSQQKTVVIERPAPTSATVDHTGDERALIRLAEDSTYGFVNAVNSGDFSYVAGYIDPNSEYYTKQKKAIAHIHNQGITETFITCDVREIRWINNDSCNMTQHTIIRCDYADGSSKNVEETYTYLMRRIGNSFYYSKMYE